MNKRHGYFSNPFFFYDDTNRLLSFGGISYAYNGDGNRVSQTASSIVTKYLLDTQPGLALVIAQTTGANTERYIHGLRGIHAVESPMDEWSYQMQDGLGSVRGVVDANGLVTQSIGYSPYGVPDSNYEWAFTGEQRDGTGIQYHRARYYNSSLGIFPSLDPFEGMMDRAMSLNGYSWVEGNVVNMGDASGENPRSCIRYLQSPGGMNNFQSYLDCLSGCPQTELDSKTTYFKTIRDYADALYFCKKDGSGCDKLPIVHGIYNSKSIPDNQLDALAMIFDYAAGYHTLVPAGMLTNIVVSELFMTLIYGILQAAGDWPYASPILRLDSGPRSGFHLHYQQKSNNQAFHFMFFLGLFSAFGPFVGFAGDFAHECNDGGTDEDARLSTVAFRLAGNLLTTPIRHIAGMIKETLETPFGGALLPHYYLGIRDACTKILQDHNICINSGDCPN